MPTGVKLLTDGSSGAPQLYATAQSLVTVLDYVLVTQAGWERVYTDAATTRVYRARTGVRHSLRVQDGVVTGSITVANISGFEAMTGISTGTNEYQGAHSSAAGHYQGSNGTGPHPWIAVVDDRTVTFLHKITGGAVYGYELLHFGDQRRRNESDPHRTILCAKSQSFIHASSALNAAATGTGVGWITPRNAPGTFGPWKTGNQLAGTQALAVYSDPARGVGFSGGTEPYPALDGRGALARIHIGDPQNVKHVGWCRGLWAIKCAPGTFADRDSGVGAGTLANRTFLFVRDLVDGGAGNFGPICLETSDTWDTNTT